MEVEVASLNARTENLRSSNLEAKLLNGVFSSQVPQSQRAVAA